MAQEIETRIRALRTELTRLVREGQDDDGIVLLCMLAELERLENQHMSLRVQVPTQQDTRRGDSQVVIVI